MYIFSVKFIFVSLTIKNRISLKSHIHAHKPKNENARAIGVAKGNTIHPWFLITCLLHPRVLLIGSILLELLMNWKIIVILFPLKILKRLAKNKKRDVRRSNGDLTQGIGIDFQNCFSFKLFFAIIFQTFTTLTGETIRHCFLFKNRARK